MSPAEGILAEALAASRRSDEGTRRAVARRIPAVIAETPAAPGDPLDAAMRSRLVEGT